MPHDFSFRSVRRSLQWLVILLVFFTSPALAFTDGSGWQIVVELQTIYNNMVKQIQALKAQSDTLSEMKQLYKDTYDTYKTVKYFDTQRVLDNIERDFKGLTSLDSLQGKSSDQQLRLIERELDRRIDDAEHRRDNRVRDNLNVQKSQLQKMKLLSELQGTQLNSALNASNDLGARESAQITAQSTAILATIAADEAQRQQKQDMARQEAINQEQQTFMSTQGIYRSIGQSAW